MSDTGRKNLSSLGTVVEQHSVSCCAPFHVLVGGHFTFQDIISGEKKTISYQVLERVY